MNFLQLAKEQRYSVREFKSQPAEREKLELIPDYLVPVALLPIGYAADGVEPHPWHWKRFDMGHTVFYNSFDGSTEGESPLTREVT